MVEGRENEDVCKHVHVCVPISREIVGEIDSKWERYSLLALALSLLCSLHTTANQTAI